MLSPTDADALNRHPLHVAALIGELGVVRLLLKAGADPNGAPEDGPISTPLAYARERQENVKDPLKKQDYARIIDLLQQAHATR